MANLKFNELTGYKFNLLTVVSRSDKKSNRGVVWSCVCECGGRKDVVSSDLKSGNVKSCGCIRTSGLEIGKKLNKDRSSSHVCPSCNVDFKVKPSRLKRNLVVCCSISCREKYLSKNPEKRPRYKNRSDEESFFYEKATRLKISARKRGKEYDEYLDGRFLFELWNKQKGKCFYTNIKMNFIPTDKLRLVSIDRVDNNKGYTVDNVVLCTYAFNSFKFNMSHKEVLEFVKMIKEED